MFTRKQRSNGSQSARSRAWIRIGRLKRSYQSVRCPGVVAARRSALLLLITLAALVYLVAPPLARADGDPASDVLLGQNVFFPYAQPSRKVEDELYSVTNAAQRAGFPLRIALIQSKIDLGAIPQYFGRPEIYARYLSYEIGTAVSGQVLVVMANGFGRAINYHPLSLASLAGIHIGKGSDGLGIAAVAAAERLAAAAGHPLGAGAASQSVELGGSSAQISQAFDILLVLFGLTALALIAAAVARRRRARAPA
jgi:hypothetical protein